MPIIILAGGRATRLQPLTDERPKSLIEVAGHPFLWHQLNLLSSRGIHHVVLAVGYLGEQIQQKFGDGSEFGMRLEYSYDGPRLLGTAGAIRQALPLLLEQFFVLYGDSYLNCDYAAVQQAFVTSGCPALMTVFRNEGLYDRSNVEYERGHILHYDKRSPSPRMRHIDYGLGVFSRELFTPLPRGEACDLADVYQKLLAAGKLAGYEVAERFYEIGSPSGLQETAAFLQSVAKP